MPHYGAALEAALDNVRGIQFRIETLEVENGHRLGRLRPDEDGYYRDVPLAVLGIITQNNTYYKPPSFVEQITSETSYVNRMMKAGKLHGEWGHPDISNMTLEQQVRRLSDVNEKFHSHHFRSLGVGAELENGGRLVVGDLRPCGPYGKYLQESFEAKYINTSFSLRSITTFEVIRGVSHREMKKLVTFDYVTAGGYAEACKRYAPGTESVISIDINPFCGSQVIHELAMECFNGDSELNDFFEAKKVTYKERTMTVIPGRDALLGADGRPAGSLYANLLRP